MARIPEDEVERLKREVSVERLALAAGVELKRHGADLVGRCPFHEDETPSLVVTPSKNLWHCVGACRQGGSAIDWVMKAEGVSFRHAVELLRADLPVGPAKAVKTSTVRKLEAPIAADGDDRAALLQVVAYYHEQLAQSPEALQYLEKRGLRSSEMVERFKLGFANRTLGYRLPAKNRKAGEELRGRLTRLGILRESGHEHFAGSLVVPIFGEEGEVLGVYGRKVTPNLRPGTPLHLYLPGPHRGVWNWEALQASKTVIVCEALIDALTFWCAGYRYVTASYGVEGFTKDHLDAMKRHGTRTALIAYDRDEAGDRGAEALAKKLQDEGIDCYRVLFPRGMDANEYAQKVTPAEKSLGLVLRQATWMGKGKKTLDVELPVAEVAAPSPTKPAPVVSVEPVEIAESIPSPSMPEPAAVSIQRRDERGAATGRGAAAHPLGDVAGVGGDRGDGVARAAGAEGGGGRGRGDGRGGDDPARRSAVPGARAREEHELRRAAREPPRLAGRPRRGRGGRRLPRGHGGPLLGAAAGGLREAGGARAGGDRGGGPEGPREDPLEARASPGGADQARTRADGEGGRRRRRGAGGGAGPAQGPAARRAHPPGLRAVRRHRRGGEQARRVPRRDEPEAGRAARGDRAVELGGGEELAHGGGARGDARRGAGEVLGDDGAVALLHGRDLKGKILAIVEEEGASRASYALKLLQSEGELSIASTGKDPATGRLVTHEYRVEGPVMIFLTTTAIELDEELLNRCLVLTVDEDREQTKAIHRLQRERQTLEGLLAKRDRDAVLALHRNAQRLIRPLLVANPYARELTFQDDRTRTRRDHVKYLSLIRTIALLHQHQRPVKTVQHRGQPVEYVEVTLEDLALANRLAHEVLGRSLDELPPQTRRVLLMLDEVVTEACAKEGIARSDYRFTRRAVRERTGLGNTQLKIHLGRLEELEYVAVHSAGRGVSYELVYDGKGKDGTPFLTGLIDLERLGGHGYDEKWSALAAKWSGVKGHRSGSGRPSVGPESGVVGPPRSRS